MAAHVVVDHVALTTGLQQLLAVVVEAPDQRQRHALLAGLHRDVAQNRPLAVVLLRRRQVQVRLDTVRQLLARRHVPVRVLEIRVEDVVLLPARAVEGSLTRARAVALPQCRLEVALPELADRDARDVLRIRVLHDGELLEDLSRELARDVELERARLGLLDTDACAALEIALLRVGQREAVVKEPAAASGALRRVHLFGAQQRLAPAPELVLADLLAEHERPVQLLQRWVVLEHAESQRVRLAPRRVVLVLPLPQQRPRRSCPARRPRRPRPGGRHGRRRSRAPRRGRARPRARTRAVARCPGRRRLVRADERDQHVLHLLPVRLLLRARELEGEAARRHVVLEDKLQRYGCSAGLRGHQSWESVSVHGHPVATHR